jgi:quinol monooxygenase YgiN
MVILLSGRVQPGRRDEMVRFLRDAVPFCEMPGNILTRLLRSPTDPNHFVEVIEYADRSSYERDQGRVASDPEMRAYLERWHSLLAEPPSVRIYDELTGEFHVT